MAVTPTLYDLTVYRGTTMDLTIEVDGLVLDGATASVECGLPIAATVVGGTVRLRLTPTQTASAQPGDYGYEAYVHLPGGDIHMLLMGRITVSDGVL